MKNNKSGLLEIKKVNNRYEILTKNANVNEIIFKCTINKKLKHFYITNLCGTMQVFKDFKSMQEKRFYIVYNCDIIKINEKTED